MAKLLAKKDCWISFENKKNEECTHVLGPLVSPKPTSLAFHFQSLFSSSGLFHWSFPWAHLCSQLCSPSFQTCSYVSLSTVAQFTPYPQSLLLAFLFTLGPDFQPCFFQKPKLHLPSRCFTNSLCGPRMRSLPCLVSLSSLFHYFLFLLYFPKTWTTLSISSAASFCSFAITERDHHHYVTSFH